MKDLASCPPIMEFKKAYGGAVNLLCIEDREELCSLLCQDVFVSPLLRVKGVHSFAEAKASILSSRRYHSWVLDLSLERHNDGIDLLGLKHHFPYCVVLTGCCSVDDATDAIKAGAYCCYDKMYLFTKTINKLIDNVCSLSALSFALKATRPPEIGVFFLLLNDFIRTPEEWAKKYFHSFRSIWNFCKINSELTPKQFLCFFHAIRFVLLLDCLAKDSPEYDAMSDLLKERSTFYTECVEFVMENDKKCYRPLFFE